VRETLTGVTAAEARQRVAAYSVRPRREMMYVSPTRGTRSRIDEDRGYTGCHRSLDSLEDAQPEFAVSF
jgi:hypothetical protein